LINIQQTPSLLLIPLNVLASHVTINLLAQLSSSPFGKPSIHSCPSVFLLTFFCGKELHPQDSFGVLQQIGGDGQGYCSGQVPHIHGRIPDERCDSKVVEIDLLVPKAEQRGFVYR